MMRFLFSLLFTGVLIQANAEKIHYNLRMTKPQNHYFEVEMVISEMEKGDLEVKLPVWAPGSYLIREFSKNLNQVKATDDKGNALPVTKKSKNSWVIAHAGEHKAIMVRYEVYAFELSVRTSFLDLTHGFVSGPSVFMYIEKAKTTSGTLTVFPYKDFKKVSTALAEMPEKKDAFSYKFENYDQLVDCPIEIGNQETFSFTAAGVKHDVAIYGPGNHNVERLKKDMARIVETETAVFGENPNKNYTFIIHNVVDGQGGLEHCNSTTLSVNRWTYEGSEYEGFLSLVAHEYFHLWNVKRIRPIELGPFNYDEENYTTLLWVMEGFTSYYDELIPLRAGVYTPEQFLSKINSTINYVEGSEGTRVQPVAHASFDAWIKAYRPSENSSNTTMTYYSRGAMLAAILDAKIIAKTNGKQCLDHFMQKLYQDFYKKLNRGFSETEFKKALSDFMQEDMSGFFADFVDGTKVPPFAEIFEPIGVTVRYTGSKKPNFGASLAASGNTTTVKGIRAGSAAETAGLSVNDEIIGFDHYRVSQSELDGILSGLQEGAEFELLIAREDQLMTIKCKMGSYERASYKFSASSDAAKTALREYWLRSAK